MSATDGPASAPRQAGRGAQPFLPRWVRFGMMPFTLALIISMVISAEMYVHARNAAATPSPLVQLMGLSDGSGNAAPAFTLTDQHNKTVALTRFRGKAVLLAFMDSHCTQVCPVLAQEFRLAEHDLGSTASRVAFVAVNVNPMGESVSAVEQFSQTHGLTSLANWYFLTGPTTALQAVWKAYGITVIVPKAATQTVHADYLYFLDPNGRERYIASPQVDQRKDGTGYLPPGDLNQWGQGIATYLRKSLAR